MNIELVFRILTLALLVSALSISIYYRRKADQEGGQLKTKEGQGLLIVLRLITLVVLLPLFGYLLNPDWVTWARLTLPDWVRWLGVLLGVAIIPCIYWLFSSIGNNISPVQATRQNHKLITSGPYRYIRHPLYTFGALLIVSIVLMTGLWWLAVGALVPIAILLFRTPIEEARLVETFGDEYRDYMKRTGRFFPRLG
jgi:protein-S-isoprenylcysteine O-methyltransferase Ste14